MYLPKPTDKYKLSIQAGIQVALIFVHSVRLVIATLAALIVYSMHSVDRAWVYHSCHLS